MPRCTMRLANRLTLDRLPGLHRKKKTPALIPNIHFVIELLLVCNLVIVNEVMNICICSILRLHQILTVVVIISFAAISGLELEKIGLISS